jgi:hypothetical protein
MGSSSTTDVLKRLLARVGRLALSALGRDSHAWLFSVMEENARIILDEKAAELDKETLRIVLSEDERGHFGDMDLPDRGLQTVVRSFTIDRILFLRECLGREDKGPVADLGDSNGIFLRSIGRDGISLNISEEPVRILHEKGFQVIRADIEHLPFKDDALSTLFLFETLEHVPNPIQTLNEAGRVCSGSLILSIPYVTATGIYPRFYDPEKPLHQHHIFEFTPGDLNRIVTHTPFTPGRARVATVIEPRTITGSIVLLLWRIFERDTYCGCFRRFYLCELLKKKSP